MTRSRREERKKENRREKGGREWEVSSEHYEMQSRTKRIGRTEGEGITTAERREVKEKKPNGREE